MLSNKTIRFQTTFAKSLKGSQHPDNHDKFAFIEIPAPNNVEQLEQDGYALTEYIEQTTGMFCFAQIVLDKPFNFKELID